MTLLPPWVIGWLHSMSDSIRTSVLQQIITSVNMKNIITRKEKRKRRNPSAHVFPLTLLSVCKCVCVCELTHSLLSSITLPHLRRPPMKWALYYEILMESCRGRLNYTLVCGDHVLRWYQPQCWCSAEDNSFQSCSFSLSQTAPSGPIDAEPELHQVSSDELQLSHRRGGGGTLEAFCQ